MKGTDLLILKAELGIESHAELSRRLGITERTLYHAIRRDQVSRHLALAAAALRAGLEPYTAPPLTEYVVSHMRAHSSSTLDWMMKHRSIKLTEEGPDATDERCPNLQQTCHP